MYMFLCGLREFDLCSLKIASTGYGVCSLPRYEAGWSCPLQEKRGEGSGGKLQFRDEQGKDCVL